MHLVIVTDVKVKSCCVSWLPEQHGLLPVGSSRHHQFACAVAQRMHMSKDVFVFAIVNWIVSKVIEAIWAARFGQYSQFCDSAAMKRGFSVNSDPRDSNVLLACSACIRQTKIWLTNKIVCYSTRLARLQMCCVCACGGTFLRRGVWPEPQMFLILLHCWDYCWSVAAIKCNKAKLHVFTDLQ